MTVTSDDIDADRRGQTVPSEFLKTVAAERRPVAAPLEGRRRAWSE